MRVYQVLGFRVFWGGWGILESLRHYSFRLNEDFQATNPHLDHSPLEPVRGLGFTGLRIWVWGIGVRDLGSAILALPWDRLLWFRDVGFRVQAPKEVLPLPYNNCYSTGSVSGLIGFFRG